MIFKDLSDEEVAYVSDLSNELSKTMFERMQNDGFMRSKNALTISLSVQATMMVGILRSAFPGHGSTQRALFNMVDGTVRAMIE